MSLQEISSELELQLFPTQIELSGGNRQLGYRWKMLDGSDWKQVEIYPPLVATVPPVPLSITWNTSGGALTGDTPYLTLSGSPPLQMSSQAGTPVTGNPNQFSFGGGNPAEGIYRFTATVIVGSDVFTGDPEMIAGAGQGGGSVLDRP